MNITTLCMDIFVLGCCIAAAPYPTRDYWCANINHRIATQAT